MFAPTNSFYEGPIQNLTRFRHDSERAAHRSSHDGIDLSRTQCTDTGRDSEWKVKAMPGFYPCFLPYFVCGLWDSGDDLWARRDRGTSSNGRTIDFEHASHGASSSHEILQ